MTNGASLRLPVKREKLNVVKCFFERFWMTQSLVLLVLVGLSSFLATDQHSGAKDFDDDVALSLLKTPPGGYRGSSLLTSLSAEAVRKRFGG